MNDKANRIAGLRAAMNGIHWAHDYPSGPVTGTFNVGRTPPRRTAQDEYLRLMNKHGHDDTITMKYLGISPGIWTHLTKSARDALITQLKSLPYPSFKRKVTIGTAIDSKIDGKDAILTNGGRIVLRGDPDWDKAARFVGYAFDEETFEETIARSRRNVAAGRERMDEYLKAHQLYEMMNGRYAALYRGYVGPRRKAIEVHHDSEGGHPLHRLYVKNRPS